MAGGGTGNAGMRRPALRGGLLALLAALLFGVSTPLVQRLGAGLGSFTTAALLYAGAALAGAVLRRGALREAAVRRTDVPRIALLALAGAVIGPVALAWGLQRTSGASASLMLALEAVFTALLARWWYREALGRRVAAALMLMTAGAMALSIDRAGVGTGQLLGLLAVLAATAAWGADNALSRPLAERDPGQVVMLKSALGATVTALIGLFAGEARPGAVQALALLAVGATGYGISLRLYLLAQRAFGAARTASVFAFAPFVGALLAVAMGERAGGAWMVAGAGLMLGGVILHLAETHAHEHAHEAMEHEHAHRHDDGHHEHGHVPTPAGWHSHSHVHAPLRHAHPHLPDAHHTHRHGGR